MINLKIDPEFQSQIPPLTDDEFKQLEENILKEGKLLSPLIVWNNTLVDGHNRYAIFRSIPKSTFSTMPLPFESREEVLAWICKNQLGRRNLTPEQKKFLHWKAVQSETKAAENFGGNQYTTSKEICRCVNMTQPHEENLSSDCRGKQVSASPHVPPCRNYAQALTSDELSPGSDGLPAKEVTSRVMFKSLVQANARASANF